MRQARFIAFAVGLSLLVSSAHAANVTVQIPGGEQVTLVGAINRWDRDGNPRKKIDPKARIDVPAADAAAESSGKGEWTFKNLAPGKYDLVILAGDRVRIEGFTYPPVQEFDPFFPSNAVASEEARDFITDDVKKSQHYENKVAPLFLGGDKKTVRVLVMLIRDKETSYEADFPGAATMRHEVWQYTWNYGGWVKDRRTRVFDRVMLHRDELRKWTWLWDPKLGGINVDKRPVKIQYILPAASNKKPQGLRPY